MNLGITSAMTDPFSLFTIKNEQDELFVKNVVKTWTIALGMCPKFTSKHIEELVKILKATGLIASDGCFPVVMISQSA